MRLLAALLSAQSRNIAAEPRFYPRREDSRQQDSLKFPVYEISTGKCSCACDDFPNPLARVTNPGQQRFTCASCRRSCCAAISVSRFTVSPPRKGVKRNDHGGAESPPSVMAVVSSVSLGIFGISRSICLWFWLIVSAVSDRFKLSETSASQP